MLSLRFGYVILIKKESWKDCRLSCGRLPTLSLLLILFIDLMITNNHNVYGLVCADVCIDRSNECDRIQEYSLVLHQSSLSVNLENVNNPTSNRGLDSHKRFQGITSIAYIHWIRGVFVGSLDRLIAMVKGSTKSCHEIYYNRAITSGEHYAHQVQFTCGSHVYFNQISEDDSDLVKAVVELPGHTCERLGGKDTIRAIWGLNSIHTRFTRLDSKLRVSNKLITLSQIIEAGCSHNYSGVRNAPVSYISREFDKKGNCIEYSTHNFGSRNSSSMTRYYDPYVKHGIKGYVDIESEIKGEKAALFGELINNLPSGCSYQEIALLIASVALGQVDFIERRDKNLKRCPRLDWWQALIDVVLGGIGLLKIPSPVYKPRLERTRSWIERQVLGAMAALKINFGSKRFWAWFNDAMDYKSENLPRHWAMYASEPPIASMQ